MSAIPRLNGLSERVSGPLREVAKRRWRLAAGTGLLQLLIICLTVWLATALIAGSITDLPRVGRVALGVFAWGTLVGSLVVFLRPAFARRSLSSVARQVESDLGDSRELLSSAVELSLERDARFAGSPELVAQVLRQAEEAARSVKPEAIVPLKGLGRWAMALFPVLLCWAVLMPAMPTPLKRGLYMLLTPWKTQVPAGLAAVTVTPGDATIAEGDPLEITASIAPRLRSKPTVSGAVLEMRFASGQGDSVEMTRTGPREFKNALDHPAGGFTYRIVTEDGSSTWHAIKVMPRPAVAGVDVLYSYPAYTRLPAKSELGRDGSIDALAGTMAQLTIHSTQALDEKSRIVIGEKTAEELSVPLAGAGNNAYVAKIAVTKSTQYRMDLVNRDGLSSRDDLVRPITARPDQPPVVAITSPGAKVVAPPDETVPVAFTASDDFGLVKIEAIVQIDGQSPEAFDVPFVASGNKTSGRWNLSIPAQLAKKNLRDASRIEYQLRATDNREPNPQMGFSSRQIVEIDHSFKESVASRREAEAVKNLTEAIKKAIAELEDEKAKLDPLVKSGAGRLLSAAMKQTAAGAKNAVVQTGTELGTVAEENLDGAFGDVARQAKNVVDGPIRTAGEELATAILSADQIEARQKNLTTSAAKVEVAEKALEALLNQLKFEAKQEEVARALKDMAQHEKEIARELAKPEKEQDRGREMQRQQALRQRLEEVLNQNKELDTPVAREAAQRNQQLVQKIEQLEKQQKSLEGMAEKQEAVKEAQEPLNNLAERQKELNEAIGEFAKKEQPELKDANARTPAEQKLENIVQALRQPNRAAEGNQQQREAANELKQAAQQLANAAKSNDAPPGQRERQDKQDRDRAKAAEKEAADIGKQVDAAKDAKDRNQVNEQLKQKEQQLAQKLEQQANEMKGRDPGQKDAVEAAQKEIAQAKQDAQNGEAAKAEQELAEAAQKLEGAAEGDDAAAQAEQKEMAADAKKAGELAQKQQELADQGAKAAQAMAQAKQQQGDPQQLERGEQQAAGQAEQVGNEAAQARQQDQQQGEKGMADRAAEVQNDLKEAAKHEQAAMKASQENEPKQAAAEQKGAEKALAKAERDARGLPEAGQEMAKADPGKAGEKPGEGAGNPAGAAEKGSAEAKPAASSEQLKEQAAASAQEARQAEQEAMNAKPRAAAEAARALAKAAQAFDAAAQQQAAEMAKNNPLAGDPSQNQASAKGRWGAEPGNEPGQEPGSEPGNDRGRSSRPGAATETRGADVTGIARVDGRPEPVKEIGISASDWAKLPPLVQQQLLNAAQQSGPSGYQEKIKNYFVKIAKIQAEEGEAK